MEYLYKNLKIILLDEASIFYYEDNYKNIGLKDNKMNFIINKHLSEVLL